MSISGSIPLTASSGSSKAEAAEPTLVDAMKTSRGSWQLKVSHFPHCTGNPRFYPFPPPAPASSDPRSPIVSVSCSSSSIRLLPPALAMLPLSEKHTAQRPRNRRPEEEEEEERKKTKKYQKRETITKRRYEKK